MMDASQTSSNSQTPTRVTAARRGGCFIGTPQIMTIRGEIKAADCGRAISETIRPIPNIKCRALSHPLSCLVSATHPPEVLLNGTEAQGWPKWWALGCAILRPACPSLAHRVSSRNLGPTFLYRCRFIIMRRPRLPPDHRNKSHAAVRS